MTRSTALESAVDDVTRQINAHGLDNCEFCFVGMVNELMRNYAGELGVDVPRDEMEAAARAAIKAFRARGIARWGREGPIVFTDH